MTEMLIPLRTAERIFIAMSVMVQELERRTDYDTANLHLILHEYTSKRDKYMKHKGWFSTQIQAVTDSETEELQKWLDSRAEQSSEAQNHLQEWEDELRDNA